MIPLTSDTKQSTVDKEVQCFNTFTSEQSRTQPEFSNSSDVETQRVDHEITVGCKNFKPVSAKLENALGQLSQSMVSTINSASNRTEKAGGVRNVPSYPNTDSISNKIIGLLHIGVFQSHPSLTLRQ